MGTLNFARVLAAFTALGIATVAFAGGASDFTPFGTQPGLSATLDEPLSCASCHGASFSPGDAHFMPHSTWSGSMMANALRDPLFWAALDVAEKDVPGVGDYCLRCHTPVGWLGGRVRKDGKGNLVSGTNGCLLQGAHDEDDGPENDYAGVTCHLCHRMTPVGPLGQSAPRANANFWIDDSAQCNGFFGPCRHGPFDYAATPALVPPHGWTYSAFTVSSAQCGTCHDVSSPTLENGTTLKTLKRADGTDTGRPFPAERTYTEWRQSRYADVLLIDSFDDASPATANAGLVPCQQCHMRKSTDATARACTGNPSGSRTAQMGVHEFVGGNTWVVGLLERLYGGPAGLDRVAAFQRTATWALELLTQRTADVQVTLEPWTTGQPTLRAHVAVTNRAGHKFPTGYGEGRRAWVHLVAHDATNAVVFESGNWNATTGALAGDPQLRVYETLQGVWDAGAGQCRTTDGLGRKQFHFVLNDCIAKDTRIPPEGFRLASADDPTGDEIRPVGIVFEEVAPGVLSNVDRIAYDIAVPAGAVAPIRVTATLKYQIASDDYIRFLRDVAVESGIPSENAMCGRDWSTGPSNKSRGQFVYDLWLDPANGRSPPVDVRTATATTP